VIAASHLDTYTVAAQSGDGRAKLAEELAKLPALT
jgi:hypothetical protein